MTAQLRWILATLCADDTAWLGVQLSVWGRARAQHGVDVAAVVVAEGTHTFRGTPRPLTVDAWAQALAQSRRPEDRMAQSMLGHMVRVTWTGPVSSRDAWSNERAQRNALGKGVAHVMRTRALSPEESWAVCLVDVDEVVRPESLPKALPRAQAVACPFFYYSLRWRHAVRWRGPVLVPGRVWASRAVESWRNMRNILPEAIGVEGVHASYFMSPADIRRKLQSFSHQEFNRPPFTDVKNIAACIREGRDLFGRRSVQLQEDAGAWRRLAWLVPWIRAFGLAHVVQSPAMPARKKDTRAIDHAPPSLSSATASCQERGRHSIELAPWPTRSCTSASSSS